MHNSESINRAELPSSQQLLRSTIAALITAMALLVGVVLPAEYGVDPTGVGRVLRLTEMGEIKLRLANEAAADAAATSKSAVAAVTSSLVAEANEAPPASLPTVASPQQGAMQAPEGQWRDEKRFRLTPKEGIEIKLRMKQGDKARFAWSVDAGVVNFDTHGDGGGRSISYEKGRGVATDEGELVAAFDGNHGWYWRNRGTENVVLTLRTGGTYSEIKGL